MSYPKDLWQGKVSLWTTFWLFGVLGTVVVIIGSFCLCTWVLPWITDFGNHLLMIFIWLLWVVFVSVSIWRSATRYPGPKGIVFIAKTLILLGILGGIGSVVGMCYYFRQQMLDPERTSVNIGHFLKPDPKYPYIGFWKEDCKHNFGLAIDKAQDGLYSVDFYGPGGCSSSKKRRHGINLEKDPTYHLIDLNTIEEKSKDEIVVYHRCAQEKSRMPSKDAGISIDGGPGGGMGGTR